jgi:hypothetical protein
MRLIGLKHDQGPLAFVSKLLLLRKFFKVLPLRILELRTVYRRTQAHTNNKENKIRTVHQSMKTEQNNISKTLYKS